MIMLWLLACGPDYSEGQIERGSLNCQILDICGQLEILHYESVDACVQDAEAQTYPASQCPNYVPARMRDCLSAYQDAIDAKDCETDLTVFCDVCD